MSIQLYVGNLAYDVTEEELTELFSAAGSPSRVRLPTDRETGKPRGFGFVEFSDRTQAEDAIRRHDKTLFKGRPLAVNEARPREEGSSARAPAPPRFNDGPGEFSPSEAPGRPNAPRRNFGPDALPRNKRRQEGRTSKKEGRPGGPPRPEGRGNTRGGADPDDLHGDLELDDFRSWAQADAKEEDPE
ncbi:MAG: hypothetical protein HZB55_12535 [Deltaproteobacteria bacterium]|nr:hypothetical protein [Deltaproteobacteria bacterium]